jgi:hypothetical protein
MVSRGLKTIRQPLKNRSVVVADLARLAVHQVRRGHDLAPESLPNRLVSQADAQNRFFSLESFHNFQRDARLIGIAGAGRNDNSVRILPLYGGNVYFVVAEDLELLPQLAQVLNQVISERVVIIDYQDHRLLCEFRYRVSACERDDYRSR